eukprot:s4167_g1.t1
MLKRDRASLDIEDLTDDGDAEVPAASSNADAHGGTDVMKPRGSATAQDEPASLPPGPSSYTEVFMWQFDVVHRNQLRYAASPPRLLPEPLCIQTTSSYSGIGAAEVAAAMVQHAMEHDGMLINLVNHSQTEVNPECQGLLSAKHIMSDICERVSEKLLKRLQKLQSRLLSQSEEASSEVRQQHGERFLNEAARLLDKSAGDFHACVSCKSCGSTCAWAPPRQDNQFWIEVAGNTCTPWSSRGKMHGWLDPASVVALIWAFSLKFADGGPPDVIINENVVGFPAEKLFHLIFPGSIVCSHVWSPCDLGIPSHRPRRYTLVFPRASSKLFGRVSYDLDTLRAVCFRRLQLRGSVFLQAPADQVKQALDKLAENKGLPALPAGQTYSCKHVMVSGDAVRMEQHRERLICEGIADLDWNVDVKQTVRFATKMQVIPTVLRAATIYNLAACRLFLLSELMSVQGFPRHLQANHPALACLPHREFFANFDALPEKDQRSMIGNSMSLCQIGVVWALVLMQAVRCD